MQFPPDPWQLGASVVVVEGHVIAVVLVVVVVTVQQKPTMSGVRVTSPARHAGRILTGPLRLPSRWRLAHRTSALAVTAKRSTPTSDARTRVGLGVTI